MQRLFSGEADPAAAGGPEFQIPVSPHHIQGRRNWLFIKFRNVDKGHWAVLIVMYHNEMFTCTGESHKGGVRACIVWEVPGLKLEVTSISAVNNNQVTLVPLELVVGAHTQLASQDLVIERYIIRAGLSS